MDYVNHVRKFFINKGFECTIRINNDPDNDFLVMCYSKYFVTSGGGFSKVIKEKIKGGIIIKN